MYAGSKSIGESAHKCILPSAFAARRCDKYRNLMHWPKYLLEWKSDLVLYQIGFEEKISLFLDIHQT